VKLAEAIQVRPGFGRSINLERDFYGRVGLEDYVLTTTAAKALRRVADALAKPGTSRAWTITGPYGSGKSIFSLVAANLLHGTGVAAKRVLDLLEGRDRQLWAKLCSGSSAGKIRYFPILVTGSREPIPEAILRGIRSAVTFSEDKRLVPLLEDAVFQGAPTDVSGTDILRLLDEISSRLSTKSRDVGTFLVIDELGKLLEYAVHQPQNSDVYLLQELAEATKSPNRNFLLMTLLHQAFERYTDKIRRSEREEWVKVQGRFEDIAFQEPNEQVLGILENTFSVVDPVASATLRKVGIELAQQAFDLRLCGTLKRKEAVQLLSKCMPIHPTVALALGSIFRRYGQNERSLFAFLTSDEPLAVPEFLADTAVGDGFQSLIRLHNVYDYLISSMGSALYAGAEGRKWVEIETALERLSDATPLLIQLTKTIGLLRLLGDVNNLRASREVLYFALADDDAAAPEINEAITTLSQRGVITERRFNNSFVIWEGSDVNLEERFAEAQSVVEPPHHLGRSLRETFTPRPLVAKRHTDETGTLRYFDVVFADVDEWDTVLQQAFEADGRIVYLLPADDEEREQIRARLLEPNSLPENVIGAIPDDVGSLREGVYETACWMWVRDNTPKLETDRAARTELAARLSHAETSVIDWVNDIQRSAESSCHWYRRATELHFDGSGHLQKVLSEICDEVYFSTPKLLNELVNRRQLSSAAAAARRVLCESMISSSHLPQLGINGYPPQLSMYFSLLQETTIHRYEDGKWGFYEPSPDAESGVLQVWSFIRDFFKSTELERRTVLELYTKLQQPPFGLKAGVLPVFLVAALLHYDAEVALYERDSFVPALTLPLFERMAKAPDLFTIQYCRIGEVRSEVISNLGDAILSDNGSKKKSKALLSLVRPLVGFSSGLEEYAKHTSRISHEAQNVRKALISAREPDRLIFKMLPEAVGIAAFSEGEERSLKEIEDFCQRLKACLSELRRAYQELLAEIESMLGDAFQILERGSELRNQLQRRCEFIRDNAVSARLRSFLVRVSDTGCDSQEWLESIGALLVGKPTMGWTDTDAVTFEIKLAEIARTFLGLETLTFELRNRGAADDEHSDLLRLSITHFGKDEVETIVPINESHSDVLKNVEAALNREFSQAGLNGNLRDRLSVLAALSLKLMGTMKVDNKHKE
jgi:hypothetical protein